MKNKKYFVKTCFGVMSALSFSCASFIAHASDPDASDPVFSVEQAKENLAFAKDQYLTLIENVNQGRYLNLKPACIENSEMICIPRGEEHGGIYMEKSERWTNGFFPGVLWKLLSSKAYIDTWQEGQEQLLYKTAKYYQKALFSEAKRGSTHDLGFLLYDSFGEALSYQGLEDKVKESYIAALATGRETLITRYDDNKGVIRSWDWIPRMRIGTIENGKRVKSLYHLADPWTYPVIVDNMMNLEFLLDSDVKRHHQVAFNHAKQTQMNHYFYDESDVNKKYPLAYHVFDYGANKPGNWQGLGNISAWARGQAWSLYGYVTVVEAMKNAKVDMANFPDFDAHLQRLFGSIEYLLKDEVVPYWDFFATRENAYQYAENVSPDTTIYSGILTLCDKRIEPNIKPYVGYRPITLDASLLSKESLQRLKGKVNWYGEKVLQGYQIVPCGTKPYANTHLKIPRDTSAAALYAAAIYRYANFTNDIALKEKYAALADKIMAELSNNYRTDRSKNGRPNSLKFGFVLAEATGNMDNASEIDTPIVYGDFYFIEANVLKLQYEQSRK